MTIEERIAALGLTPPGVAIDCAWTRVHGGRIGAEVTPDQAAATARLAALSALARLAPAA